VSSLGLCQTWQVACDGFTAGNCGCTLQLLPEKLVRNVEGDTFLGHHRSWEDLIHSPNSECNLAFELVLLRHYTCDTVVLFSLYVLFLFPFSFGGKCIIFQTFSAYETCFQSMINFQDDT